MGSFALPCLHHDALSPHTELSVPSSVCPSVLCHGARWLIQVALYVSLQCMLHVLPQTLYVTLLLSFSCDKLSLIHSFLFILMFPPSTSNLSARKQAISHIEFPVACVLLAHGRAHPLSDPRMFLCVCSDDPEAWLSSGWIPGSSLALASRSSTWGSWDPWFSLSVPLVLGCSVCRRVNLLQWPSADFLTISLSLWWTFQKRCCLHFFLGF